MRSEFPTEVSARPWMVLGETRGVVIEVTTKKALSWLRGTRSNSKWDYLRKKGKRVKEAIKPKIVLLFGASGSGKDVVIEEIEKQLKGEVVHLSSDWYYGPFGKFKGKKVYGNNYDHPNAVDWSLLRQHLRWLKAGFSVAAPRYDFTTHFRKSEAKMEVLPKRIILVSGIMVGHALAQLADLAVGVKADWRTCVKRRVLRDVKERGRTKKGSLEQIKATVWPGYKKFVKPCLAPKWWQKRGIKLVLVDNQKDQPEGLEPARVNSYTYIEQIRKL